MNIWLALTHGPGQSITTTFSLILIEEGVIAS